jgi:hypothetical protein
VATAPQNPGDWEQYKQLVELYTFYLNLFLTTLSVFWLISGGVATFVFSQSDSPGIRWALLVPIIMTGSLAITLLASRRKAKEMVNAVGVLARKLDVQQPVHAELLLWLVNAGAFLMVSSTVLWIVGIAAFPAITSR